MRCGAVALNHSGNDDFSIVDIVVELYHDGRCMVIVSDDDVVLLVVGKEVESG